MKQTDPQFKLRIPPELKDRLDLMAEKNSRSLTSEILLRLETTVALDEIIGAMKFGGFQAAPELIPKLWSENEELYDARETFRKQIRDEFSKMLESRIDLLESRLLSLPDSSFGKSLKK